ncbi:MAG: hypothetical protein ACKVX7_11275 [Planctomycetota bacterium]
MMMAKTVRGRLLAFAVLCFGFASLRTAAFSQWEVLVLDGINSTVVSDALAEFGAGVSVTIETTNAAFDAQLTGSTSWDLVIVANSCCTFDSADFIDYVNDDGRAIVATYDLDGDSALRSALGVTAAASFSTPTSVRRWASGTDLHALWRSPNAVVSLPAGTSLWADDGDRLTVSATAGRAVGGFSFSETVGEAGVFISRGGRVVTISHVLDGLEADAVAAFLENCIEFLIPSDIPNSTCATAIPLFPGFLHGNLLGSTGLGVSSCAPLTSAPDVWYTFDSPVAGVLEVRTCGTNDSYGLDQGINTSLAIYESCGGSELDCDVTTFACLSLDGGVANDALVSATLSANQTVWIRVSGGTASQIGPFRLYVEYDPSGDAANDTCSTALPLTDDTTLGTWNGATGFLPTSGVISDPNVWYTFTASTLGTLEIDTCGSSLLSSPMTDTFVHVFDACSGATLLDYNDDGASETEGWPCGFLDSRVTVTMAAGETVVISVGNLGPSPGQELFFVHKRFYFPPLFRRADSNADGLINIADAIFTLSWMFVDGPLPSCGDSADHNDDGLINIADPISTLSLLFSGGPPPPPPYAACGTDPTPDGGITAGLDCDSYSNCP